MSFLSPTAPGRNISEPKTPAVKGGQSKQLQTVGAGQKAGPVPSASSGGATFDSTPREFSGQVQFSPNPYGSNILHDGLSRYKQKNLPATTNPGPQAADLSRNRKAPARTGVAGSAPSGF